MSWETAVEELCPALLRGLDPNIRQTPQLTQQLSLTVAGAANCTGSGPVLTAFLLMLRTAVEIEKAWRPPSPGTMPQLTWDSLEPEHGTDPKSRTKEAAVAAAVIGFNETCFHGGGHSPEELTWSLNFSRDIRPFAEVRLLTDYWRVREEVLGAERAEAERRPYSTRRPEVVLTPALAPLTAAPVPVAVAADTMTATCDLYPLIAEVAAKRFSDGHYVDAVVQAFKAVGDPDRPLNRRAFPELASSWVPEEDTRRLQAYKLLAAYDSNQSGQLAAVSGDHKALERRELGDPGKLIDTALGYLLGSEQSIVVPGAEHADDDDPPADAQRAADRQEKLRDWAEKELLPLRIQQAERCASAPAMASTPSPGSHRSSGSC